MKKFKNYVSNKKRYNNVATVLRNGDTYYLCDTAIEAEFNDIK